MTGGTIAVMSLIQRVRKQIGLSQREISRMFNKHQTAWSHWERGRHLIPPETAMRFVDLANQHGIALTMDELYKDSAVLTAAFAAQAKRH